MSRSLRYTLILALVALGTALAAVSGWRYARASAPVTGPIILISIDALRADHLPAYGFRDGRTPAIDGLAKDGIVFERAYSHVPQTLPAHASILTGRLPFEHGVRDGAGFTLNASERLLAEMLRDRGYATGGVVSSFLLRKETGIGQGFTLFDDGQQGSPETVPALERDGTASEHIAEQWFDAANTTRAFLFLHLAEPGAVSTGPTVADYDARITAADEAVGRLVRHLKARQLYEPSTIVVVSDHGQGLGDHGESGHGALLYDEALRVPLIVKPAAGNGTGLRVTVPVQQIDIVPTVLDLAKAPGSGSLRGRSLTPLFAKGGRLNDRVVYSESLFGHYHFGWSPIDGVTDGRYRLVRAGEARELFDLETDPTSRHNIADASAAIVTRLEKSLADFAVPAKLAPMEPIAPADRDKLERLGYVGIASGAPSTDLSGDVAIVEQYRTAVRLSAAGDLAGAVDAFRKLTAAEPQAADAWLHLAAAAARAERHDIAADAYQRVVQLAPETADGSLGAAQALLRMRKYEDARVRAQAVIDGPLGDSIAQAMAHELLARVALSRRNFELARSEAAKAEERDAKRPVTLYVAGRIAVEQRRYADALDAFEQALEAAGTGSAPITDLKLYAAEALLRAERPAEAEYQFLEQLKLTPIHPRALAGLTTLYKASGRTDEAARLSQH